MRTFFRVILQYCIVKMLKGEVVHFSKASYMFSTFLHFVKAVYLASQVFHRLFYYLFITFGGNILKKGFLKTM